MAKRSRQYAPIWAALKKTKHIRLTVDAIDAKRVAKALTIEKNKDIAWQLEQSMEGKTWYMKMSREVQDQSDGSCRVCIDVQLLLRSDSDLF